MNAIIIAFILVFSMALNIKILARLSNGIDISILNAIEIIAGFLLTIFIVLALGQFKIFKSITAEDCFYFVLSGFFSYGLAGFFSITHIRLSGDEKNALLSPLVTILVVVAGYFALSERVNSMQLIGISIVSVSVLFYQLKANAVRITLSKPKEIIILATLCFVIVFGIILTRIQINYTKLGFFEILFLRYSGALPVAFLMKRNVRYNIDNSSWIMIFTSVFISVVIVSTAWVYCNRELSNITFQGIFATLPFAIVSLNYVIEKRYPSSKFLICSFISLLGILILFMS
ncbi:EamA family transporter [Sediminibacterium sp.]|jgi:drug/metabolite transporter (DMT)-like permease|uniref:EamA family transporter n=1 Tax=Sediminibacterium sp. TaxID=1917865 RepID=UPI003F70DE67